MKDVENDCETGLIDKTEQKQFPWTDGDSSNYSVSLRGKLRGKNGNEFRKKKKFFQQEGESWIFALLWQIESLAQKNKTAHNRTCFKSPPKTAKQNSE